MDSRRASADASGSRYEQAKNTPTGHCRLAEMHALAERIAGTQHSDKPLSETVNDRDFESQPHVVNAG